MGLRGCSRLDRKARRERVQVGIGVDLGAINVEFFAPDQLLLLALLYNGVEEAAKDVDPIAFTNTCEAGMIGQGLSKVVPQVPPDAQTISRMPHQLPFRAYPFKEHHQLQFEEHHRINGGAATTCIGLLHKLAHKGEVERSLHVTVEMI